MSLPAWQHLHDPFDSLNAECSAFSFFGPSNRVHISVPRRVRMQDASSIKVRPGCSFVLPYVARISSHLVLVSRPARTPTHHQNMAYAALLKGLGSHEKLLFIALHCHCCIPVQPLFLGLAPGYCHQATLGIDADWLLSQWHLQSRREYAPSLISNSLQCAAECAAMASWLDGTHQLRRLSTDSRKYAGALGGYMTTKSCD
jgi:hypothetical protein